MNTKFFKVSLNGQIVEPEKAEISVLDHGFMKGIGVFETFRVSDGKVFLLDKHFERLSVSLKFLNISWQKKQCIGWLNQLTKNIPSNYDGRVRLMVTAKVEQTNSLNYLANTTIYLSLIDKLLLIAKPAKVLNFTHRQLPEYLSLTSVRLKTPDYLSANLAQQELNETEEGILLTPNGYVAEALTSNIFWANDGQLYTPPLSLGILPGIIRNDLIVQQKIEEKLITAKELEGADEIFLTNSVNYITPLGAINQIQKPGTSGKVFKKLHKKFHLELKNRSEDIHSFTSVS